MRPTTITALIICGLIVITSFIIGISFDLGLMERKLWLTVLKNGGVLGALLFAILHFLKSKPAIYKFTSQDWKKRKEINIHKDVFVIIPESCHKKGKNPSITFLNHGKFVQVPGRLTHKIEGNGDIFICHVDHSFMPPYESFTAKITM